jgi:hypothetical protein
MAWLGVVDVVVVVASGSRRNVMSGADNVTTGTRACAPAGQTILATTSRCIQREMIPGKIMRLVLTMYCLTSYYRSSRRGAGTEPL